MAALRSSGPRRFQVVEGPGLGRAITLLIETCSLIGRSPGATEKTVLLEESPQIVLNDTDVAKIADCFMSSVSNKRRVRKTSSSNFLVGFRRVDDFVLEDPSISRLHAMLFNGKEGAGIVDLGSTNGTLVNQEKKTWSLLQPGDEVVIGSCRIFVEDIV